MAEKEGFLGMAFTNTSPLVFPTRGSEPTYGTNPISCFAPASKGDRFQLDMATTTGFRLIKVHSHLGFVLGITLEGYFFKS